MSRSERSLCIGRPWRMLARRMVPWTTLGTQFSGEVLEIGGGGGGMAEALAEAFPQVGLTVTDIDEAMVDVARTRLAHVRNASVRRADVTELPFADGDYDTVVSFLMLHHVVDWEDAVAEVARVLRPGGLFVGYDLTDTPLARVIHVADGSPHRLIRGDQFESEVGSAGLDLERMHYSGLRHLFRFVARKPSR